MFDFTLTPQMVLFLPVLWLTVIGHEIGHAYAAFRAGDDTASLQGRLSLNPMNHIDPIGTVLIPIIMMLSPIRLPLIGWAKPVPVNPARFKSRKWDLIVSLAGVSVNLAFLVLAMIAIKIFLILGFGEDLAPREDGSYTFPMLILTVLSGFVIINMVLLLFNLIPIPPLDGSHVLLYFIKSRDSIAFKAFQFLERFGFILLILLLWVGALQILFGPVMITVIIGLSFVFQVPPEVILFFYL